ncbi:MAG: metallophosphoesterase family protein [Planctomycetota bacterium]
MTYPLTAIVSDLHANEPALDAVLADAHARAAQRYVCLGDVIGYGARPTHNLDSVMRLCVPEPHPPAGWGPLEGGLCLQGNHEFALLYEHGAEEFNPKARAAIDWTRRAIGAGEHAEAYWDFLGELEPSRTDEVAMFAHGSPRDPVREYIVPRDIQNTEKMAALFACMERPVCFVGHSHVPAVYYEDHRLFEPEGTVGPYELGDVRAIVNVGSVGQPRDGDPRASYVLFDGRTITFVRVPYAIERAQASIRAVDALPGYLADRLAVGR